MNKNIMRPRILEAGIWICWLIACLTRNNWIVCSVCAIGFVANIMFMKNSKKSLKYIISCIFFFAVVVANLYVIFFMS